MKREKNPEKIMSLQWLMPWFNHLQEILSSGYLLNDSEIHQSHVTLRNLLE